MALEATKKLPGLVIYSIFTYKQMVHLQKFPKDTGVPFIIQIERDAFYVKSNLCKDEVLDLGVEPPRKRLH